MEWAKILATVPIIRILRKLKRLGVLKHCLKDLVPLSCMPTLDAYHAIALYPHFRSFLPHTHTHTQTLTIVVAGTSVAVGEEITVLSKTLAKRINPIFSSLHAS